MKAKIIENYILHYNRNGKMPVSIFEFCESMEMKEADFYNEFADFNSLESQILSQIWTDSVSKIVGQDYFAECTNNEKLLAAVYAFVENLKNYRSYLLLKYKDWSNPMEQISSMQGLKKSFFDFLETSHFENKTIGIKQVDSVLEKGMYHALFTNLSFVFHYWLKDSSKGFEKTDACIEKSFALSFQLIANNSLSTAFDLGKFLFSSFK
jgi:hypothetical protein